MCIAAGDTCQGGANLGCLEGSACSNGRVCCLSLLGGGTSCVVAPLCTLGGGIALCTSSDQCPTTARNCCRFGQTGVCRAQPCQ